MSAEVVQLRPELELRAVVEQLYARAASQIHTLIPTAEVLHVGATALPGGLTKGDLDLQVRVEREIFERAARALETLFVPRAGPELELVRTFWAPTWEVPLDLILTARDVPGDVPWRVRDVLLKRDDLRAAFHRLQRRFEGRTTAEYRAAKDRFFREVLASRDFGRTWQALSGVQLP